MQTPSAARITVLSPCFNDGSTIVETVDSIDEVEPIEVVIVDDGSSDAATISVLADLERRDGVRVVRHAVNRGVAAAMNTGLKAATTPYVFIIGADDLVEPGALAALADALDVNPDAVAAWGTYELFGARSGFRATPAWDPWRVTYNNYWTGVAMVRRAAILELGGFSERSRYEDWDMWMTVAQAGRSGVVIDRPMFRYRFHQQSVRRCATAKDAFPGEYAKMRDGHRELFARRAALETASSLTRMQRFRERVMLRIKLLLPKYVRRAIYGGAAWIETRRSSTTA